MNPTASKRFRRSKTFAILGRFFEMVLGEGHIGRTIAQGRPMRPLPPPAFFVAVVLWLLAILIFGLRMQAGLVERGVPEGATAGQYTFELISDAQESDYGITAQAVVFLSDGQRASVLLSYEGDTLYFARERIVGNARFSEFSDASFERYASEGLVCRVSADDVVLADDQGMLSPLLAARRQAAKAFDGIEGVGSALLRALLIGDRSKLDESGLYDAMKSIGLAHLVAVSGSHLAIVGTFVSALMVRLGIPRKACVVLLCLFYASYAVLTGLSAPVVRSGVMATIAISCIFAARRASPLAALSVCVSVLIALEPTNALSLSFFLSAASTFGVVVFSSLFSSWFACVSQGRVPSVAEGVGMTTAANLPIFPVTASVFARIPLITPLANLMAAPVFSLLLLGGLGSLCLWAVLPSLGGWMLNVMCFLASLFCYASIALSHVPFASLPCGLGMPIAVGISVVIIALLWFVWPMPSRKTILAVGAFFVLGFFVAALLVPRFASDEIIMLDVGQGDAILIRSQGASLLVDTGNQDSKLLSALGRHGISSLDGVLITHYDDDHCASLPVLDSALALGGVYLAASTLTCECEDCDELLASASLIAGTGGVNGIAAGQSIQVGRFTCTVVWPEGFSEEGGNADSLCLLVEYDAQADGVVESSVFLTGDAGIDELNAITNEGLVGDVDVFKVAHHGSKNSVSESAYAILSPEIALISVGENNQYGHPTSEALTALEEVGAEVFRTDLAGDITCRFSAEGIEVFTQNAA